MTEKGFEAMGMQKCSALQIVLTGDREMPLGGPHYKQIEYPLYGTTAKIEIEQCIDRTICISTASPIPMRPVWDFFSDLERLLMLFDGRFYTIKTAAFSGNDLSADEYECYVKECLSRRLSYYKTVSSYCHPNHKFLEYDAVLTPELFSAWMQLQEELDIVHPVVLYNIADTKITCDVKCAYLIECMEPMVEIIGEHIPFFPSLKPGDKSTTLKMCIDAVISKYGSDIFSGEYAANKDKFLSILVKTRVRIMHIKRHQSTGKFLSGSESVLYIVKLFHLYRVVLLSLLGIEYESYRPALIKSINQWTSWNGVYGSFMDALREN